MIKEYASLHCHSHYSLMDAISTPEELVKTAKEKGIKRISLTDHGVAGGHIDLASCGKKYQQPIALGVEAYLIHSLFDWAKLKQQVNDQKKAKNKSELVSGDELTEKDVGEINAKSLRNKGHLVLLACNQEGLRNLYRAMFLSYRDGFYGKPRMDKEILANHSKGLIASSACLGGVISKRLWQFKKDEITWNDVVQEVRDYESILGIGRFFLELQFNEDEGQRWVNRQLIKLHQETNVPLTCTNDSHYIKKEDWEVQEVLYMLRGNKTVSTRGDNWVFPHKELYLKSPQEMWDAYLRNDPELPLEYVHKAFEGSLMMESLIEDFELDTHIRLPNLGIDNPIKELANRCIQQLNIRGLNKNKVYVDRLFTELKVIKQKGFADYFLITQKILDSARLKGPTGIARGSAAGSLISYLLNITDLNPIDHDLLFERFLDPERDDPPDIDCDVADQESVREELKKLFGEENVASIITYSTFNCKGLLKDLGRIFDMDHNEINKLNKQIEAELLKLKSDEGAMPAEISLETAETTSPTLKKFLRSNPEIRRHYSSLINRIRHTGIHPAGMVVADNLSWETPIMVSNGRNITAYSEGIANKNLSKAGFIKFDFLGLNTLNIIEHTCKLISERHTIKLEDIKEKIRPHNINLNDQDVLRHVYQDGHFINTFQFAESAVQNYCKKVKPNCFEDIAAITSIQRPGPLQSGMDDMFLEGKHHPETVTYDHEILEQILKPTAGCLIFQEQVLSILNKLGKLPLAQTNKIRKLLTKKAKGDTQGELDKYKEKFTNGCIENGYKKSDELWTMLIRFSSYGFNSSHAKAYAATSFQCAWLYYYYRLEFFSAILTHAKKEELQQLVDAIKKDGTEVLPVCINKSKDTHIIENDAIRLSFKAVKGAGDSVIPKIISGQPYSDLLDCIDRSGASKTALAPLIRVGALSTLDSNWKRLDKRYELYTSSPKYKTKKGKDSYLQLYHSDEYKEVEDFAIHEKVAMQNDIMGFSIIGSVFDILDRDKKIKELESLCALSYKDFMDENNKEITETFIPVVVKEIRLKQQSKGGMMAFLRFGVNTGEEFETPCFSGLWKNIEKYCRVWGVYLAMFHLVDGEIKFGRIDPENGRSQYWYSERQANDIFIDIDKVS